MMSLSSEQQLEMYGDIKVIKNNCARCLECQKDHERRIKSLERSYWKILGGSAVIMWLIQTFLR